jgi:hypothetical protein
MLRFSLSTSSSKNTCHKRADVRARFRWHIVSILLWAIGALILIDIAVGFIFRPPSDNRRQPTNLELYFNYGQSIEGKLRHYIGFTPEQDAAILKSGWLADTCDVSTSAPSGRLSFDIYGMSFTNQIADHMELLDSNVSGHRFSGPAAPPNHSYACFIRRSEASRDRAPIQILGILASSVLRMKTISGLTTSFESPEPFTYPRYSLAPDGKLIGYFPSIMSQNDLRTALADSGRWNAFLDELDRKDAFYVRSIMQADLFDHSVIGRLIRRAWGQHVERERTAMLHTKEGFMDTLEIAIVLRAMMIDFANKAHQNKERPIIILIENHGYGGSLSAMLAPLLKRNQIEFLSTSDIISSEDSSNFLADGHFTSAANQKIARATLNLIGHTH